MSNQWKKSLGLSAAFVLMLGLLSACGTSGTSQENANTSNVSSTSEPQSTTSDAADTSASVPSMKDALVAPPSETPGVYVSEDQATEQVLAYAGISENDVDELSMSLESDEAEGKYYLVQLSANGEEHVYKVSAVSGTVTEDQL